MAEIKSPEFQRLLLEMFFLGKPPPETMWVGLCQDVFAVTPTIVSLAASEPAPATGYMRQPILKGMWQLGLNPTRVNHEGVTFTNRGTERWPVLRTWFLVAGSSQADGGVGGPSGQEVLVDWGQLRAVRVLLPEDRLVVPLEARWPS